MKISPKFYLSVQGDLTELKSNLGLLGPMLLLAFLFIALS